MRKIISFALAFIMAFSIMFSFNVIAMAEETGKTQEAEYSKEKAITNYSSNLPVVYIDTENGAPVVSKDYYINATIKIQGSELYPEGSTTLYNGKTEIKGRGNTTWSAPKKPYRLKLDKKTDLFGFGSNKHWVLLANYTERSLMRNSIAYDLSGQLGMPYMKSVMVDVVFNGEYVGNYQLCEHIRISPERVNIQDIESIAGDVAKAIYAVEKGADMPTTADRDLLEVALAEKDLSWITKGNITFKNVAGKQLTYNVFDYIDIEDYIDTTGGYLMELDEYYDEVSKFRTKSGQPLMFSKPEFLYTNSDLMKYVQDYVQAFEDAVNSPTYSTTYNGETVHYTDLFDMEALVKYWLIEELFFNEDFMKKSTYLYKGAGEKFKMGPVWDMDWSSAGEGNTKAYDQWATKFFNIKAQNYQWYKQIIKDPAFVLQAYNLYNEIRSTLIEDIIKQGGIIDTKESYLSQSAAENIKRWYGGGTYAQSVSVFRNWMKNRVSWLDSQFASLEKLSASLGAPYIVMNTELEGSPSIEKDIIYDGREVNYKVNNGSNVTIKIEVPTSKAQIYLNDTLLDTINIADKKATYTISNSLLSNDNIKIDTIEIRALDDGNNVVAGGYITIYNYLENISYTKGDVNNDGVINIKDVILILRAAYDLEQLDNNAKTAADYNNDGIADEQDAKEILRFVINGNTI